MEAMDAPTWVLHSVGNLRRGGGIGPEGFWEDPRGDAGVTVDVAVGRRHCAMRGVCSWLLVRDELRWMAVVIGNPRPTASHHGRGLPRPSWGGSVATSQKAM